MNLRNYIYLLVMLPAMVACEKISDEAIEKAMGNKTETTSGSESSYSNNKTEDTSSSADGNSEDTSSIPASDKGYDATDKSSYTVDTSSHIVVFKDDTSSETETYITLLSLNEWSGVCSANYDGGAMAKGIADAYREGTVGGWRIPTEAEAKKLKEMFLSTKPNLSDALNAFNEKIKTAGGMPLHVWDVMNSYSPWRYLCEEGKKTFSMMNGTIISAGAKSTSTPYHLRLLRDSVQIK